MRAQLSACHELGCVFTIQ